MKKFLLFFVAALASLSAWAIEQDSDGYYLIGSAADWDAFAAIVATTNDANARMTADIDLGKSQAKIGGADVDNPGYFFKGIFDGQGHTLTIHYVPDTQHPNNICSPFPNISEATIKNLHLDGTIVNSTSSQEAPIGIVRYGQSTIKMLWSSVNTTTTRGGWDETACFVGNVDNYKNGSLIMTDCLFTGKVTASNGSAYNGCFIGYINAETNPSRAQVSNCLSAGTFDYTNGSYGAHIWGDNTNCYIKSFIPSVSIPNDMQCTDEQIADGTIAMALQAGRTEEVWVQDEGLGIPMLKIFIRDCDVNGDGAVTSADVTCIYNYLLTGYETFIDTCDVDGDGSITVADITTIYNIILGAE